MTGVSKETIVVLGAGATAALIAATTWYQYAKRKNRIPDKWMEVGTVGDLWIYPLKSGRAMEVEEAECTETGLIYHEENKFSLKDRGLLVYRGDNKEQRNAKNYPRLLLITVTTVNEKEIKLEAPNMSPLITKTLIENPQLVACTLHQGERQQCVDCGDEAAKWISQYCAEGDFTLRLGLGVRSKRSVNSEPMKSLAKVYKKMQNEDLGIFSDICSYLIFNQASLEDLNKRLPADVSPLNFRPNIVVEGPEAYVEDDWDWIKIGKDAIFRNVKPCTRCTLINFDPKTAVPVPERRVLKKLQEYRLIREERKRELEGNAPAMGVYAGIRKPGQIKLGDKVYIG
ncbi:mitochondrial amidoxime-reducing component 1-like [Neodiprion pinetum]|uniref:Mitochondrial amidoxime-reducing component 1 n=1 Tax=Neodiprion lecontei TaxID=441921 RepID=A0A6J0BJE9_NEOLC|nr:mitochondrial amidoxime-reducing component 1 [Neodiprion lecontei]XP_046480644.1 mitochondrial amidoxime-reducing component 1-like [Neodiprion pinetum]XP_046595125.1 mitochondrial amidoxime-reducing component 1 [Neodiprion lecontei]